MSFRTVHRLFSGRLRCPSVSWVITLFCVFAIAAHAASIRGVVTDASGARVTGATVDLISNGQVVGSAVSGADGSFQIMTGQRGRFFLVVSATKFRQLETPGFYAGQLDNIERNIVLEPEWVHESIVVTATGTPTPQPQTGAATSVIGPDGTGASAGPGELAPADARNVCGAVGPAGRAEFFICARRRF